jgi:uncharacterized membrane protein YdfJ with MMPL/SSD domain
MNDLIFWGIHLCVVAIALAIVWVRLDATTRVMTKLVTLQNDELALVRKQTADAEEQTRLVEQRETKRGEAVTQITSQQKELIDNTESSMDELLGRVKGIATDVTSTLDQIRTINKAVLGTAIEHKAEAIHAEGVATQATKEAVSARTKAAMTSGALAQKKRQLKKATQVIAKEKKKNFVQRIFQPINPTQ